MRDEFMEPLWEHPREVWEKLGRDRREKLAGVAVGGLPLCRSPSATLVIVENGQCGAHPLERVAAEWGCRCAGCERHARPLENKPALHELLADGRFHAVNVLRVFLCSPDLAFPPDIPTYALKCYAYICREEGAVALRMKREVAKAKAQEAFTLAYRGKKR